MKQRFQVQMLKKELFPHGPVDDHGKAGGNGIKDNPLCRQRRGIRHGMHADRRKICAAVLIVMNIQERNRQILSAKHLFRTRDLLCIPDIVLVTEGIEVRIRAIPEKTPEGRRIPAVPSVRKIRKPRRIPRNKGLYDLFRPVRRPVIPDTDHTVLFCLCKKALQQFPDVLLSVIGAEQDTGLQSGSFFRNHCMNRIDEQTLVM